MTVLSGLVFLIGYALVRIVSKRQFNAALIGEAYQVQTYNFDNSQYYETSGGSHAKANQL